MRARIKLEIGDVYGIRVVCSELIPAVRYAETRVDMLCLCGRVASTQVYIARSTLSCNGCARRYDTLVPQWLLLRLAGARRRCTAKSSPNWKRYGGRGIKFKFPSSRAAASWVRENIGMHKELQLDRIDNDGHYEPGNLRWATRIQNARNRRISFQLAQSWSYDESDWPYGKGYTENQLRSGMTRDKIIARARALAVKQIQRAQTMLAKLDRIEATDAAKETEAQKTLTATSSTGENKQP